MTTKSIFSGARRADGTGLGAPNSLSRSRRGFLLIPFAIALAWFALSPAARALLPPPPPDGGYPNGNTAEGTNALFSNTTGGGNTAIGFKALLRNTTGGSNTATGYQALVSNTDGGGNTAYGAHALRDNKTSDNTANGFAALANNTYGHDNTANGSDALESNTEGLHNTATGSGALRLNNGNHNTASGAFALFSNTTGSFNTANGAGALYNNTTGISNTAIGLNALLFNTTGGGNIALGRGAGRNLTKGNNNIAIGNEGVVGQSNTIRIGTVGTQNATFIAGIRGSVVAGGVGVLVGLNGQLGTAVISSARFKDQIKPMDKASEAILALKPVTFRYKHELDPEGIPQFGLVAEQVEKVNPDLVARDGQGKVNTVRYEAVNAMLLNEFLKEHRKVQELEAAIAQQQKEIKALAASLKEQALQIQKVASVK